MAISSTHRSRTYRRHSPHESAPLVIAANGAEFFRYPTLFTDRLQFKRCSQHDRSAAEGVVVGVGVDAVEDGVGVVALVQEVLGSMQAARQQAVKVLNLVAVRVDNESAKVKGELADARKATDEATQRLYDVLNALAFCILFLPVSRVECCFYHVKEARFRGGVSLLHIKSRPVDG